MGCISQEGAVSRKKTAQFVLEDLDFIGLLGRNIKQQLRGIDSRVFEDRELNSQESNTKDPVGSGAVGSGAGGPFFMHAEKELGRIKETMESIAALVARLEEAF